MTRYTMTQKEIGITHDETPEQKADRENAEKFADTPITADEIDGANISDVEKTLAKAYLNGNQGFLQKAAYLKAYDNVRNRRQDGTGDSLDAEGRTQLDSGENKTESRPGRTGEPTVPVDETKGGVADEGQRRLENGEGQSDTPVGERGNRGVSGAEPSVDGLPSGGERPEGSRESGGTRRDVRGAESDKGGGKDTPKPAAGSDAAIAASKQRLAELRQRFKKAGRNGTTSVSLAGMNAEQISILMDMTTAAADIGYQYLVRGVREFKEWNKQMLEELMASDCRDEIAKAWTNKDLRLQVKGHVMGAMTKGGAFLKQKFTPIARIYYGTCEDTKESVTLAKYMGEYVKTYYGEWIKTYVERS